MRKDHFDQAINEALHKLNLDLGNEIARAMAQVEKKIEIAKGQGTSFEREAGYLSGLKFAAALVELQGLEREKHRDLLRLGHLDGSDAKCEAV